MSKMNPEKLRSSEKEIYHISKENVSFEDAFEASGCGKFNNILTFVLGIAMAGVILEVLGAGFILSAVMCEFQISVMEKGMFSTSVFIGIVVSSPIWGYFIDTKGRRTIILPTLWIASTFSIISSFSPNLWFLITSRCICGFFLSATAGNTYTYLAEMHVNKSRTKAIAMVAFSTSLALIALPGLAWLILPLKIMIHIPFLSLTYTPWRLYIVICSIPNFIAATALICYPESPKFLYVNDRKEEAIQVLKKMYSINTNKPESLFPFSDIKDCCDSRLSVSNQTLNLFKTPLVRPFVIVCFGQATLYALSGGLYLWFPVVFNQLREGITICDAVQKSFNNHTLEERICETTLNTHIYIMGMITGAIFGGCSLILRVLISFIDKNLLLIVVMSASGLSTLGLHWVTEYYAIIILFVICLCSGCAGGIITAIGVDLFPTQHRGMAITLSLMVGRFGAILGANLSGYMFEHVCDYTFLTFGIICMTFVATVFYIPRPQTVKEGLKNKGVIFQ